MVDASMIKFHQATNKLMLSPLVCSCANCMVGYFNECSRIQKAKIPVLVKDMPVFDTELPESNIPLEETSGLHRNESFLLDSPMSTRLADPEKSIDLDDLNIQYATSPIIDENNPLEVIFEINSTENERKEILGSVLEKVSNFHLPGAYFEGRDIDAYVDFLTEIADDFQLTDVSFLNFSQITSCLMEDD